MTEIGEKWRMLSPENRLVYERLAEQDLLRVKIQQAGILSPTLEAWEELSDEGKRSLYVRLVDLVRRPDALMQGQGVCCTKLTLCVAEHACTTEKTC